MAYRDIDTMEIDGHGYTLVVINEGTDIETYAVFDADEKLFEVAQSSTTPTVIRDCVRAYNQGRLSGAGRAVLELQRRMRECIGL